MSLTITSPPFLASDGQNIGRFPMASELTVAQAAQFLDMSEACMDGLLVLGAVEYREDNGCRLIKRDDLIEYEQECAHKRAGVDEIIRLSEEMGLYDDE